MTLLFERVRVCTTCYAIYKKLEKYYFKTLWREEKLKEKLLENKKGPKTFQSVEFYQMTDDSADFDTARIVNQKKEE